MKNKGQRFFNLISGAPCMPPANFVNESRTEATIYVYDEISWWGCGAEWFVGLLNSMLDVNQIHVRVNSPGGDIFDARAMQIAMAEHPAFITVHIDGLAASAASFFIRGANKRVISDGGFIMIHQAQSGIWGQAQELISRGQALEKIDASIIHHYAKATGLDEDQIREWVQKETWFDSAEAMEHGFVDEVVEAAPVENRFDLAAVYKNVPEKVANWKAGNKAQDPDPEKTTTDFDMEAEARERDLAMAEIYL